MGHIRHCKYDDVHPAGFDKEKPSAIGQTNAMMPSALQGNGERHGFCAGLPG